MPVPKKPVPKKKFSRRRPTTGVAVPAQLVALAQAIDGPSESRVCPSTLRDALVDADEALRRITRDPAFEDHNHCLELILQRVRGSVEFKAVLAAAGRAEELALVGAVSTGAEQGLWIGMALAYRFFNYGAR